MRGNSRAWMSQRGLLFSRRQDHARRCSRPRSSCARCVARLSAMRSGRAAQQQGCGARAEQGAEAVSAGSASAAMTAAWRSRRRARCVGGAVVGGGGTLRRSRNGTLDRLKMCASDECRRVFFDRSKPATRRWCMSSLCGNRMKTRKLSRAAAKRRIDHRCGDRVPFLEPCRICRASMRHAELFAVATNALPSNTMNVFSVAAGT